MIDKLLTRYVDALNEGKRIDVEALLKECPEQDRDELLKLIKMSAMFKKSFSNYEVNPTRRREILAQMEQINTERRSAAGGVAARTEHQNEASKQKLEDKLAEIRSRFKKED